MARGVTVEHIFGLAYPAAHAATLARVQGRAGHLPPPPAEDGDRDVSGN